MCGAEGAAGAQVRAISQGRSEIRQTRGRGRGSLVFRASSRPVSGRGTANDRGRHVDLLAASSGLGQSGSEVIIIRDEVRSHASSNPNSAVAEVGIAEFHNQEVVMDK